MMIRKMRLNSNFNAYSHEVGVYYITEKFLLDSFKTEPFRKLWRKATVVIDEFDWLLFDGTTKCSLEMINIVKAADSVFGFTGSKLTDKELYCLELVYNSQQTIFPTISSVEGEKNEHLEDVLINST
jgi:hypothetical protein